MKRVFLNSNGSIDHIISGGASVLEVNTFPDSLYVDMDEDVDYTSYYDFNRNMWVAIGQAPQANYIFDYDKREWLDPRSLDEIKAQKWAEIKSQRDQLEFGGFEYEGNVYDSDQVSQGRIMGAASAGKDQTWTLADNTTVDLTASQLQQLYAALQAHIASVHERGRIARQLIFEAETKEQVEAVQL